MSSYDCYIPDVWSVMRGEWCVFPRIIQNRKSDWCVFVLDFGLGLLYCAVSTHNASIPWRHFMDSPGYPQDPYMWSRDNVLLLVYYIVFFSQCFLCVLLFGDTCIIMPYNVIDDKRWRKIVTDFASRIWRGNLFHKCGAATTNDEWP